MPFASFKSGDDDSIINSARRSIVVWRSRRKTLMMIFALAGRRAYSFGSLAPELAEPIRAVLAAARLWFGSALARHHAGRQ